jgi:hypothetical protein
MVKMQLGKKEKYRYYHSAGADNHLISRSLLDVSVVNTDPYPD